MATTRIEVNPPLKRGSTVSRLARFQELGLVLVIAVLTVALSLYGWHDGNPERGPANTFLNTDNLIDGIATPMSYYAIMAVGMTVVVISGGIDISVASIMALAGLITAYVLSQAVLPEAYFVSEKATWIDKHLIHVLVGSPRWVFAAVSVTLPLAIGLLCGLFNGALVVGLRMHPFIVTLGTMSIFRGLCNVLQFGGKTLAVPQQFLDGGTAMSLLQRPIGGRWEDGINIDGMQLVPLAFMLVTVAIGWFFLSATPWGREDYAVGGNEEAARFSGIGVGKAKLRVYAISGLCAGLAGLVSLGRFGTMSTNTATGYELTVVAAAVVGGASLSGGRGTALGALLGTLILAEIENAINILKWNQEYKAIIVGLSIIVAVALDRLSELFRNRRSRAKH